MGTSRRYPVSATREAIWERDKGICDLCGWKIDRIENYERGHKVDFCLGGSNDPSNLAVHCWLCNESKPEHSSLEEYEAYRAGQLRKGGEAHNIFLRRFVYLSSDDRADVLQLLLETHRMAEELRR